MAASFRLLREAPNLSRARSWLTVLLIAVTAVAVWILSRKTRPPEVDFVKVTRETIVSSLSTNGKVEPIEWLPARAQRAGTITRVFIARGQQVRKDEPLVELDTRVVTAELGKAQAAIKEAKTRGTGARPGRPDRGASASGRGPGSGKAGSGRRPEAAIRAGAASGESKPLRKWNWTTYGKPWINCS